MEIGDFATRAWVIKIADFVTFLGLNSRAAWGLTDNPARQGLPIFVRPLASRLLQRLQRVGAQLQAARPSQIRPLQANIGEHRIVQLLKPDELLPAQQIGKSHGQKIGDPATLIFCVQPRGAGR
ncbi:MAG: hypothetical protein ACTSY1_02480 [Alphaproteobacteria bacterium]